MPRLKLERDWRLISNFISSVDERLLVDELQPLLNREEWSKAHFDHVIHNYRELTLSRLDKYPVLQTIVSSKIEPIFKSLNKTMLPVHVLELDAHGKIEKHVDSIEVGQVNFNYAKVYGSI
jgi:hypothetical protein